MKAKIRKWKEPTWGVAQLPIEVHEISIEDAEIRRLIKLILEVLKDVPET